jgi:adenylate cyclase
VGATREIARGDFGVRISELRSDEWGRLTDSFNKMAQDLGRARQVHDTFGQFVGPEVRDKILQRYAQLGGSVQEITVMFADIRGFTGRASGKPPEEVVDVLNRFLSLGVAAIDGQGGWVNKFLGDGFMALFGTPLPCADHADRAVAAGVDFIRRLDDLNHDLESQGQTPLKIGIGIHTGPALVGCIGATVPLPDGGQRMRLEFTAIGETVNLAKRLEELTKLCGDTLLFSDATRLNLKRPLRMTCVGPQQIRGGEHPVVVYTVDEDGAHESRRE